MDDKIKALENLIFYAQQAPRALAKYLVDNLSGGVKGEKGDKGETGAAGKDAPTITAITINVADGTITGQATMSEGEPVTITGTFTQA